MTKTKYKTKYDAIIVGAGISGLLMALALCKEKKNVLVIEESAYLGGNCRTYEIDGYYLDTGPHAITELTNGPLKILMDRYFSVVPKFMPLGLYYARWQNKLQEIPLTLTQLSFFDILSRRDRILLAGAMIDAVANSSLNKNILERSVDDYLKSYRFSAKSMRFIDTVCYFLSGKSMKETPTWRILGGSGYVDENNGSKKGVRKHFKKIVKFARHNYNSQGYPLGGIQSITASVLNSIPQNKITFKTNEKALKFIVKNNKLQGVQTDKEIYSAKTVIYSGFAKDLPSLVDKLSNKYKAELAKIKQTRSFTLWLGLKNKMPELAYQGSEVYFDTLTPYWAIPVSNFDSNLAPKNKQLVGFTTIFKEADPEKQLCKLKHTIFVALPKIKKNIEFEHTQITIPEKAAVTVGVRFPSPKSPIQGLYLIGTDTSIKSMGVTRASYSVLEALEFMKEDGVINNS
ncbi:MAG: NAD(P)-binding protein [Patescibacteria group bacterium]|nr:NAD(P)-binding protein [Patescibacteria group bacterium]